MSVLIAGFLIGMRHALDADHLAALTVLLTDKPSVSRAAHQGAAWGIGHALTLLVVGVAVIVLDTKLSPQLAHIFELAVGVMLVGLGVDLIRRWRVRTQLAPTATGTLPRRALGVGLMHGLAGSSTLILLTLGTLDSTAIALSYIALFGLGSILGMALHSIALAFPLHAANTRINWFSAATRVAASLASIGLGAWLMAEAASAL